MKFLDIRSTFIDQGVFTPAQAALYQSTFDKANLGRWCSQGLLVRLKNGLYAFSELADKDPMFPYLAANRMYQPSYVSLESAMSLHEMIPESVFQITSVSPLKTWHTKNLLGEFHYRSIKSGLMFGWEVPEGSNGARIAAPEKALLDFLWLNPGCSTQEDMAELRLDEDFMKDCFNKDLADAWAERFGSKALVERMSTLYRTYGI